MQRHYRSTESPVRKASRIGNESVRCSSPQVTLVVNVASQCGYTDGHYKALQKLQRDLGPYHFNVLGFPCNQFGHQEPNSEREIDSFIKKNYNVSFPMFSKIAVTGIGANAAFKYLTGEKAT